MLIEWYSLGTGIAAMAIMKPELIMKSIIPVVMAGETHIPHQQFKND